MTQVLQHLWFEKDMMAAVRLYTSVVPGSAIGTVHALPADSPSGPAGSVELVDFRLGDQKYMAIQAGPLEPFNHSFSVMVECDDQDEIDRLWDALGEGGSVEQCGWLRDRWGLSWQIVPRALGEFMTDPDPAVRKRVAEAMLRMVKFDIDGLRRAAAGSN